MGTVESTEDLELQDWMEAWQGADEPDTSPLTAEDCERLRRKAHRFGHGLVLLTVCEALVLGVITAWAGRMAWQEPTAANLALFAMVVVLVIVGGGLTLWNRRQTWRPRNDSIQAFLELERLRQQRQILNATRYFPGFIVFEIALLLPWKWWQLSNDPEIDAVLPVFLKVVALITVLFGLIMLAKHFWYRRVRRRLEEIEELQRALDGAGLDG